MSFKMDREEYAQHYGPTVGDSVRLGDTNLFAAIEKDFTVYGQESKFGGGKVLRDGMGVSATETRDNPSVVDTIITGATIIDYTGIIKADIGIRDGKIVAIGRGGNPDTMDNVDFVVGASTEAIAAEGLIVTAGGIDLHVHYISADLPEFGLDTGLLPSLVVVLVLLMEVMRQLVHQVNSILLVCCNLLMICLLTLVSLPKVLVLRLKWLKSKLRPVQQELKHTRTGVRLTQVLIIPLKLRINTMFPLRSTLTL